MQLKPLYFILLFSALFFTFFFNSTLSEASIYIDNCTLLDTPNEAYFLTQDILDSNNVTCMNITVNNVTLDCQGHLIDGKDYVDSKGIYTQNTNVTIKNCNISDWYYGINFLNNNGNVIENVTLLSNSYGIYLFLSNNNIVNQSIAKNNNNDGIKLEQSQNNLLINLTVSNNLNNGIYLLNSQWNNLTNISGYTNTYSGINLSSSNNNNVMFSSLYTNTKDGIVLANSNYTTIKNTSLFNNQRFGIYLHYAFYNNISYVNSSGNAGGYGGVYVYYSNNNIFLKVNSSANSGNGFYLETSSNNILTECVSRENNANGILTQISSNNNFTGCDVFSNKYNGIKLYSSNDHYFIDSFVSNSTNYDVNVSGASNNYFINTTFNKTKTSIVNSAIIWVKWYLYLNVLDINTSVPISDANVIIKDNFGNQVFSGLTNASGWIPTQTLVEYNETPSGKNYYTNYVINISKTNFFTNITSVDLASSKMFTVYLQSIGPPSVTIKLYTPGLIETDLFKAGRNVRIRAFVTSGFGRDYIKNSTITIKDNSGIIMVNSALMTAVENITNGYIYEYNYTIPQNASSVWSINITATDANGRKGYGFKRMAIIPLMLSIKLVLNSTEDSIYIPGEGEKTFQTLSTQEYTNPSHYYLASYSNEILKAVVFSQLSPVSILTEKGSDTYALGIKQRFSNSMVFLTFSKGNWRVVNNKINLIEKGEFLSSEEPSFSFGVGSGSILKVFIEYENLKINKTMKIWRGYNKIVVENKGVSDDKVTIGLERA